MTARFSFDARFYVRGQTGAEGGQFGGRGFMVWCLSNVYEKLLRQQSAKTFYGGRCLLSPRETEALVECESIKIMHDG